MSFHPGVRLAPFLSAVGKRCGIDVHYFAKSTFLVSLGHALAILRGIATGYLVARFFDAKLYGEYQFILSVMGMLSIFSLGGIATAVTRAWARDDAFSTARVLRHQFLVNAVGSLILLGCIPFLGYYNRQELWPLFVAAALIFPLPTIAATRFGGYVVGKARFDLSLKVGFIWSVIVIVCTVAIVLFWHSSLLMLLVGTATAPVVYLWMARSIHPPVPTSTSDETPSIIRYGWVLTIATLPSEIVWYLDRLLVSHYFGISQLALFSVAQLIPEQVKILLKQFIPVTFSRQAARSDAVARKRKMFIAALLGMGIFAVGVLIYIALAPLLMPILFPTYDAAELTLLTSASALTLIVQPCFLFLQYLETRKMTRALWITNAAAALSFALTLFLFVPAYGLLGAILARGAFRVVNALLSGLFVLYAPAD